MEIRKRLPFKQSPKSITRICDEEEFREENEREDGRW